MTKINLSKYDQYSGLEHFNNKQIDSQNKKRLKKHNNNRRHKDKKQDDK